MLPQAQGHRLSSALRRARQRGISEFPPKEPAESCPIRKPFPLRCKPSLPLGFLARVTHGPTRLGQRIPLSPSHIIATSPTILLINTSSLPTAPLTAEKH